ncbi:MAG: hypothetical protein H6607_07220 [Flavobacteriales bacterium]|nr:hypothetical protein [Flavobacteriales bacterium]
MKLKKQLGIVKFRNKWEKTLLNFQLANARINLQIRDCFRDETITYNQYQVLKIVANSKQPATNTSIKNSIIDNDSDVSRLVSRLISMKLLSKTVDKDDKRFAHISLTQTGKETLQNIESKIHSLDEVFFNLSTKEATALNNLLSKIRKA